MPLWEAEHKSLRRGPDRPAPEPVYEDEPSPMPIGADIPDPDSKESITDKD